MKLERKSFITGVSIVLLLITLFVVLSPVNSFIDADKSQLVTAEMYLNTSKDADSHVIIFYKTHCKDCIDWDLKILNLLEKYPKEKISYVEVSSGLPDYLSSVNGEIGSINTPHAIILSEGNHLVYSSSVWGDSNLASFKSALDTYIK